jgi:hypothetical protein
MKDMNNYERLLEQIDAFIRKYYKNQLIKGGILVTGFFILLFLAVTFLEFIGRFGTPVRAFLFFSFVGVNLFLLYKYVIIPISKLFAFGKRISRTQASVIIGDFFPEIADRLLNTLQLNDALSVEGANYELVRASISQRSTAISAIPFVNGIDLRKNVKYIKYFIPVFLLFLIVLMFFPTVITQGSQRVVNYQKEFKPQAPFDFSISDYKDFVVEGEYVTIEVRTPGDIIPDKVYLVSSMGKFLMQRSTKTLHSYVLPSVSQSVDFHFEANGFSSNGYAIRLIPKSAIGVFDVWLDYPAYLGKKDIAIQNAGDMEIPEGTKVSWKVRAKNSKSLIFDFEGSRYSFANEAFEFSKTLNSSTNLRVFLKNKFIDKTDTLKYQLQVIKDAYPTIQVQQQTDSLSSAIKYFTGTIEDDYGLKQLNFVYSIQSQGKKGKTIRKPVMNTTGTEMRFGYAFDFRAEELSLNDKIEYYFEVSDNDGVNGSKSTKSEFFTYKLPSLEALNEQRDEQQTAVRENLNDLLDKAQRFQQHVDKLKKDVLNEQTPEWNKLNQIEQLKNEQENIQNELNAIQQQIQESTQQKNELSELDKQLLEKQEMIQDLLDKLMDDEMKALLNKLEELMKSENKEQLDKKLNQLDAKSEDMQKQLDRSIEMLKRLQVNEKIDAIEDELKQLSQEQEKLKEKIENDQISNEKALQKQQDIDKKFDEIKEDLKELDKLNNSLSNPMDLDKNEDNQKSISDELSKAKENIDKGNEKKATKNQQKASQEMNKLANEMNKQQNSSNKQQAGEDVETVRALLENLMSISFNQEDILTGFGKIRTTDPLYRKYGRRERALIDEIKMVEDSLNDLAKRQPKIASFVDKELREIHSHLDLALESIDEHQKNDILINLQYVLTGVNNLALMLNESLQQMQSEMQGQGQGDGSCPNPKPGKNGSSGNMGDMKEMLKKQLESLEKGKQPGNKPGQSGKPGQMGLSGKEIAQMAAQQAALRAKLEQLRNEMNKDGKGSGNALNPLINALDQQEKDLVNRNKKADFVKRQKEIITRLLESEDALRERGFDEKRESKSAKDYNNGNLKAINQYNLQKVKQLDVLHLLNPAYRKYYKDKVNQYFNEFQ